MKYTIERPSAQRIETQADIVFCLDATASMQPCIEGVKKGLNLFAEGLQTAATVDYRLRLIAYRDLHDPTCTVDWDVFDFTDNLEEFRSWLNQIRAECNQEYRGAESALDALYMALHSRWRPLKTHKTIVLLTDDDTHPTLHPKTYAPNAQAVLDNNIERIIQDFQGLRHAMLFIVAPKYPLYSQLGKAMTDATRKVIAHWVPMDDSRYEGLNGVNWEPLMSMLGQVVSATSLVVSQDEE